MILGPTDKFYLDGGDNTYIHEPDADRIAFTSGGQTPFYVKLDTVTVNAGNAGYFRVYGNNQGHPAIDDGSNGVMAVSTNFSNGTGEINMWYTNVAIADGGYRFTRSISTTGHREMFWIRDGECVLPATNRLYLDGNISTGAPDDTYITEVEANRMAMYVGNTAVAFFDSNDGTGSTPQIYAYGEVNAANYVDRTPYPESKQVAYDSVLSMGLKEDGDGVDHQALSSFVQAKGAAEVEIDGKIQEVPVVTGRDLSATVSAQNEVIKDLISRIQALETQLLAQDARLKALEQDGAILK
jgi:hypothetical protein